MNVETTLKAKYDGLFPHLDERQRRLVAAADAEHLGRGGVSAVSRSSGLSRPTIYKGAEELQDAPLVPGRVRRAGGGRKPVAVVDASIVHALEALIETTTRGDPMSPLRWTSKSTRHLAEALARRGHAVSHQTVAELLRALAYSLQGTAKTLEGKQHPDRDAQFKYIARTTKTYLRQRWPIISVDTKKKELIGEFKASGQEYRPKGPPERVLGHDFPDPSLGKAIPYGVYDIGHDVGWVNGGTDHDTAAFAVESIRRWWTLMGEQVYPAATRLLICADAGGSNGYRLRLWKATLQAFATATGLETTVCHFPPGTSKWNKIEHRLFSHITMNWRGRPLVSHDIVVKLIGSTRTNTGLRVKARLDKRRYPLGIHISDAEMDAIKLTRHTFHGDWNYSISP